MPDTNQSRSNNSKESRDTNSKFCCGYSKGFSQMVRKFCGSEDEAFNGGKMLEMMQKMCCSTTVKSDKQ
jgi:hypothetical protein